MLKWLARRFERGRAGLQARLEASLVQKSDNPVQAGSGPQQWRQRGNAALDAGDVAEAARCYQHALDAAPADVSALVNLAYARTELHQTLEAGKLLDRALAIDAENTDAWYMLGGLREQGKDLEGAAAALRRAIAVQPDFELAYRDLCRVLFQGGHLETAKSTILKAIALNPAHADFHFYLGNVLYFEEDHAAALACFEKTLQLQPGHAPAYVNMGKVFEQQKQWEQASAQYAMALRLQPDNAVFHAHAGDALLGRGMPREAAACYERSLALDPSGFEANLHLGNALTTVGVPARALEHCRKAIQLRPDVVQAHNALGIALQELGRTQEALEAFMNAVRVAPDSADAFCNVGSVRLFEGRLEHAVEQYRRALELDPVNVAAGSNLLFALNYDPDLSAGDIFAAYREFDQRVCWPLRSTWLPFPNPRSATRRLRIGYVSPDLRQHTVMRFLEPVLASHDVNAFEIYAYAEVPNEDAATLRARSMVEHWRSTVGMADDTLAALVRQDGIDVLVDVAGHTAGNRLRVFARKPAPVSVSWLGYGYTTGLSAIDHYLTDAVAAPPGEEHLFSERPWRLPRSSWVYRPDGAMGDVGPLPASRHGYVTFGTLTRPVRINHRVVRVWAEILARVPDARLVVDNKSYGDAATSEALAARFVALGVDRERLLIGYHSPPWDLMRTVDITLDCFPHNSGTTLFESLYMGVPFVTLAGRPSVGRLGASILHGLGRPAWIADSEQDYVERAVELAEDRDALARIRSGLRDALAQSCLMDERGFTRALEQAYRQMFEAWVASLDRDSGP